MFDRCIIVNGERAEEQAKAIAQHYGVKCAPCDGGACWEVECNDELEQAFCMTEESFDSAVQDVEAATGVYINPEDIEF